MIPNFGWSSFGLNWVPKYLCSKVWFVPTRQQEPERPNLSRVNLALIVWCSFFSALNLRLDKRTTVSNPLFRAPSLDVLLCAFTKSALQRHCALLLHSGVYCGDHSWYCSAYCCFCSSYHRKYLEFVTRSCLFTNRSPFVLLTIASEGYLLIHAGRSHSRLIFAPNQRSADAERR